MSANTTPHNITYPVSTDNVAPLETVFANLANSVETAMTAQDVVTTTNAARVGIFTYTWANAAARAAQTGMVANSRGYQQDTNVTYRYNGSVWQVWEIPYTTFTPTLSTGTLGNGTITGAYSVSGGWLNGWTQWLFGSTSAMPTGGGQIVAPIAFNAGLPVNASIGTTTQTLSASIYFGALQPNGANIQGFRQNQPGGYTASAQGLMSSFAAGQPFTWATGATMNYSFNYPV